MMNIFNLSTLSKDAPRRFERSVRAAAAAIALALGAVSANAAQESAPVWRTDATATVLGTLGNGMAGLAVKEIPIAEGESWTSVYSAVGNIPADFLRNILKHKGVNIYSEEGDVIFANSNYLAIDSPYGGARTISLGGRYDVYDVFSGETVATGVTSFDTVLEAGETRLYRLTASGTGGEDPGPQQSHDLLLNFLRKLRTRKTRARRMMMPTMMSCDMMRTSKVSLAGME